MPPKEGVPTALATVGLGAVVWFGSFQMNAAITAWTPYVLVAGYSLIVVGVVPIAWAAHWIWKTVLAMGLMIFGLVTLDIAKQFYRSFYVEEYVSFYERNRQDWDNMAGDKAIPITAITKLKRSSEKLVLFTPLIGTQHDGIAAGAKLFVTIHSGVSKVKFFPSEQKVWRPLWSNTDKGQSFMAAIDELIRPGKWKTGPDEKIRVGFQPGQYEIEYQVSGTSVKGRDFEKSVRYQVEIY